MLLRSYQRPIQPKCPVISLIDSATYMLIKINSLVYVCNVEVTTKQKNDQLCITIERGMAKNISALEPFSRAEKNGT